MKFDPVIFGVVIVFALFCVAVTYIVRLLTTHDPLRDARFDFVPHFKDYDMRRSGLERRDPDNRFEFRVPDRRIYQRRQP